MRIAAPIDSVDEVDPIVDAGADELFVGVQDDASMRLHPDSPNRRYGHASLRSFEALREVVRRAHARHVEVSLAVNNLCQDAEGWRMVEHQATEGAAAGVDAVLLPDPGAVAMIRDLVPGLAIHASTVGLAHNSRAVAMYRELGVSRIVLDRQMRLSEIRDLCAGAPGVEFEAFLMNDGCFNVDGHCWCVHAPRFPRFALPFSAGVKSMTRRLPMPLLSRLYRGMYPCVLEGRDVRVEGAGARAPALERALRTRFSQKALQFRCGLCALPALLAAGVHVVKVVGRGYPTDKKLRDVRAARKSLTLAEWGLSGPDFHRHAERQFDLARGFPCQRKYCYYDAGTPRFELPPADRPPAAVPPTPPRDAAPSPVPAIRPVRGAVTDEGLDVESYLRICRGRKGRMSRDLGRRTALDFARAKADRPGPSTVVEIGCGPGLLIAELARTLASLPGHGGAGDGISDAPAVTAYGFDVDPAMIEAARREEAGSGVIFQVSRPDHIPLPTGCADLVVSEDSMHHWSDAASMLREILRIAAPDGRILVLDLNPDGRLARLNSVLHRLLMLVGIRKESGRGFVTSMGRAFSVRELQSLVRHVEGEDVGLRIEGGAFAVRITRSGTGDAAPGHRAQRNPSTSSR